MRAHISGARVCIYVGVYPQIHRGPGLGIGLRLGLGLRGVGGLGLGGGW